MCVAWTAAASSGASPMCRVEAASGAVARRVGHGISRAPRGSKFGREEEIAARQCREQVAERALPLCCAAAIRAALMTPAASCGAPSTASPPPWLGERAMHALRVDAARLMIAGGPPRELVRARPARLQLPPGGVFSLLLLCYGNLPPPSASPSPPPSTSQPVRCSRRRCRARAGVAAIGRRRDRRTAPLETRRELTQTGRHGPDSCLGMRDLGHDWRQCRAR